MKPTQAQRRILAKTPAAGTRGATGKEISGSTNPATIDRTISVLGQLADAGLVRGSASLHSRYFIRGYRRTEAGETLYRNLQAEHAGLETAA